MKKVIISIIDYNGLDKTIACLSSLKKIRTNGFSVEIVLIDNYPPEELKIDTGQYKHKLTIIKPEVNKGFAGGHNVAITAAFGMGADYIIVLNNDTTVDANLITRLVRAAESNDKVGAVVPKIYFAKGHEFHKDRYLKEDLGKVFWYAGGNIDWENIQGKHRGVDEVDKGQYDTPEKTDLLTGCCVLFPANVLQKVGLFDEKFFLYYEDADLNQRLKKVGFRVYYEPKAILWHLNAGSTGGSGSKLQDYFICRNRMLFGMRYAPIRSKLALIRESLRILQNGREWQKIGVKDFYLRKFGKGSYAL